MKNSLTNLSIPPCRIFSEEWELEETLKVKPEQNTIHADVAAGRLGRSQFRGYETTRVEGVKVVALIKTGVEVQILAEGDGEVVLDQTPFYAEMRTSWGCRQANKPTRYRRWY